MKILTEKKNHLLKRIEVEATLKADSNPGFVEVKKEIVSKMKVSEDNVVIKSIRSQFGKSEFMIEAYVYDSKEQLEKVEPRKKEKKGAAN